MALENMLSSWERGYFQSFSTQESQHTEI